MCRGLPVARGTDCTSGPRERRRMTPLRGQAPDPPTGSRTTHDRARWVAGGTSPLVDPSPSDTPADVGQRHFALRARTRHPAFQVARSKRSARLDPHLQSAALVAVLATPIGSYAVCQPAQQRSPTACSCRYTCEGSRVTTRKRSPCSTLRPPGTVPGVSAQFRP